MLDRSARDQHVPPAEQGPRAHGRWRVRRACDRRVAPLEIWNLPCADSNLHQALCSEEARRIAGSNPANAGAVFFEQVASAAAMLRGRLWPQALDAAGFGALFLCGGLTLTPGFSEAAEAANLPFSVLIGRDGPFSGVTGAESMLERLGVRTLRALAVDAGQTSVKTAVTGADAAPRVFPRDPAALPVVLTEHAGSLAVGRAGSLAREAVSFFGGSIAAGSAGSPGPIEAIALGLPCEVNAELVPGGCTYAGFAGRASLVFEILDEAERIAPDWSFADEVVVVVANDAELAGFGALDRLGETGFRGKALVLSLGFGPGAAVVRLG